MKTAENPGIASADEVAAAIAEAQSDPGSIPNLDEARRAVVPIPVEPPAVKSPRLRPGPQPAPANPSHPPAAPGTNAIPSTPPPPDDPAPVAPRGAVRWIHWIYRAADATLWAVNRPFERLADDTRRLVGIVALITLVMALTTAVIASFTRPAHTGQIPQLEKLHAHTAPY